MPDPSQRGLLSIGLFHSIHPVTIHILYPRCPTLTFIPMIIFLYCLFFFFFFNDTATTEIYTLSLHDALPISFGDGSPFAKTKEAVHVFAASGTFSVACVVSNGAQVAVLTKSIAISEEPAGIRSEEHTSELQSLTNLVCRLLLEKKKKIRRTERNDKNQNYINGKLYNAGY